MDLETSLGRIVTLQETHGKRIDDHEGRIRDVEKEGWKTRGAVALAVLLTPILSAFAVATMNHFWKG